MGKIFNLKFDKTTTRLAGYPYGKRVYEEQIGKDIDFSDTITVVFPKEIEKVASSFVQGFFSEIICNIGYAGFDRQVVIEAKNDTVAKDIREKIR